MTTIAELAAEYNLTPYGLRAYADDLLDGLDGDNAEIPADTEKTLREALAPADDSGPTRLDDGTSDIFGWRE